MQEAVFKFWQATVRGSFEYRYDGGVFAYFNKLVRTEFLKRMEAEKKRPRNLESDDVSIEGDGELSLMSAMLAFDKKGAEPTMNVEFRRSWATALNDVDRTVLMCRYLVNLKSEETAATMGDGWDADRVHKRTNRAKGKLAKEIGAATLREWLEKES